ncbi:hypothetical protein [Nonomuraea sp. KM88]|uniref:hypothetical protein n=1 Tax=Nonomuraea sp. KM88 TaxID=3457427 RepID=UPI003FCCE4D3
MDVVIADVLNEETLAVYRASLRDLLVVRLEVAYGCARERAMGRPVHLTWDEFAMLHREQESVAGADLWLDSCWRCGSRRDSRFAVRREDDPGLRRRMGDLCPRPGGMLMTETAT